VSGIALLAYNPSEQQRNVGITLHKMRSASDNNQTQKSSFQKTSSIALRI